MRSFVAVLLVLTAAAAVVPATVVMPGSYLPLERSIPLNRHMEPEALRARDKARHARILQGATAAGVVDFSVQGTSDPYFVGYGCSNCPQSSGLGIQLNFFDAASSSTAALISCSDPICTYAVQTATSECSSQVNQCSYTFQYGDGSGTTGYYVSDAIYLDTIVGHSVLSNSSSTVVFGCSTYQSGDLTKTEKAVDGIFGFGPGALSVISQLSSRGMTPKVFSHCLKGDGNGGGILVLGEILEPSIVYTPLVPSQPHYNLNLESIAVNGQLLSIDPAAFGTSNDRGTIVDSGTTLAYLVQEAYDPFVNAITTMVSQFARPIISKGNQCYLVPTNLGDIFPLVNLNFMGGASMVLKPEQYLMHYGFLDGAAMWCMGFQKVQQGFTILGDLVLKDKIFVYDLANERIGWANYDCSLSVNVSVTATKSKDQYINEGQLSVSSSLMIGHVYKLLPVSIAVLLVHMIVSIVSPIL
ncbi:hypothetical protein PIB30_074288 [Stylosanthes scabra]|uniref:Peptidase A1 domain-containing protein n=1 Tax=Stylosanthes scabra TaxID=79078 RepID=A0ABU6RQD0_9FABA|nr:hypothetical protein [Stylosanthes scabra]